MLRKVCAVRRYSSEDYASPEPPFIQKFQGLVNEPDFRGHSLQFVQVDTLNRDRIRSIYGIHCQIIMYFVQLWGGGKEENTPMIASCPGKRQQHQTILQWFVVAHQAAVIASCFTATYQSNIYQ